jgi:hypothetical protein
MKRVLLTTSAIVGLSVPSFAADPTAVSDQPYFHHSHPMTWSGGMSIALTNTSTQDANEAREESAKRDWVFGQAFTGTNGDGTDLALGGQLGANEENAVGAITGNMTASVQYDNASLMMSQAATYFSTHASISAAVGTTGSAVEDVVDDYLGGSHSEAMDVISEVFGNGAAVNGSEAADLADDLKAFQAAQDGNDEAIETTSSINTTASLGVAMSAGDGWTASTSGTINLGGGSVSGGALALTNGMLTLSVGQTAHAAGAAVAKVFGMDRALNANAGDTQLQATMALGGAVIQVDNEMDGDNLETSNQTVGIKGAYGTMSYGLGWEADGDLGFSIGTSLGGVGLTISRVNTGSTYSMGLGASVDLGGGMTLSATNAQNSDGLTDDNFNYSALSVANLGAATMTVSHSAATDSIGTILQKRAVHKSISTVGLNYAGGGTSVAVQYQEKAGTSATGDNLIASGSMAISPSITLTGSYNKDSALTTIGASGPLGSAGTISAVMTSTGSSSLTASFKF